MALSHEDVGHKINTKCTLMFIKHFENNGKPCEIHTKSTAFYKVFST